MIKLGIYGASGRVGVKLVEYLLSGKNPAVTLGAAYSRSDKNTSLEKLFSKSDMIIDFSTPEGLSVLIDLCIKHNKPLISGTTGIDQNIMSKLKDAAKKIPVFYSPNMSIGANLMGMMAAEAVKYLPIGYDVEIIDIHHKHKKDAPAGTALHMEKMIKSAANGHDIHITSIRTGDNPGEYHILFSGADEVLTISHKATSKMPYVIGACNVAIWLESQKPGIYNMMDIMQNV